MTAHGTPAVGTASGTRDEATSNKAVVARAFEEWAAGGTRFFDVLDEDAVWTIAGSGRSAQTFHGRATFLAGGFGPIASRFASPMKPKVLGLFADGDTVVIRWDGEAALTDGQTYRNGYA